MKNEINEINPLNCDREALGMKGDLNKAPICGVVATAILADKPYAEVRDFFRKQKVASGIKPNIRKGLTNIEIEKALDHFGVQRFPKKSYFNKGLSFFHWHQYYPEMDVTYLIQITGHILIYRNGYVMDQWTNEPRKLINCKSRNCLMVFATQIKKGE
jgi:hypothetical protein